MCVKYSGLWGFVLVYQFVSGMMIVAIMSSCFCAASLAQYIACKASSLFGGWARLIPFHLC
jgi:hypothetical protein